VPLAQEAEDGSLGAEVLSIDRFGDVQLNVEAEELAAFGERLSITVGEALRTARLVVERTDAQRGLGWWTDHLGMVSLLADGASAADDLGVSPGDQVTLAAGADEPGVTTPVALGQRSAPEPTDG
jgi:S-adenosylmethionine hydrolase